MVRFAAKSETGNRAGPNEDAFGALPEKNLWFIADGMGGQGHGSVASAIVRDTFSATATVNTLEPAIRASHDAILSAEQDDPELKNMGSTIVAAGLQGATCHVVWVGDSRAYLYRKATLRRLTADHSLFQELVDQGGFNEEQARSAPDAGALVRALGMEVSNPSSMRVTLRNRDRLLLCSDGLWHEVADADIATLLSNADSPEQAVDALISQALANGGRDNVSVIVVAYDGSSLASFLEDLPPLRNFYALICGALAALVLAILWHYFGAG